MKRAKKATKRLRTYLGRVIRDIKRKYPLPDGELNDLLKTASRIWSQKRKDKNKIYSVHEPHVEFINKGKAHKRYEFGCKVSVATTSKVAGQVVGGFFISFLFSVSITLKNQMVHKNCRHLIIGFSESTK